MNIGIISLGCAKNRVDSEQIAGFFRENAFEIVDNIEKADVLLINTCGFIEESKKEAIDTIFEMLQYQKITIVTGCLVNRYQQELQEQIPEVDAFIAIRDYPRMAEIITQSIQKKMQGGLTPFHRELSTPFYSAFLKISEGCNNCCTYCAIPLIRGSFHSYPQQDLLKEADILWQKGVKELVVISQDTTRYGSDREKDNETIEGLLQALLEKPFAYIRLLYLYPDEISNALIDLIAKEPRLTPYFDIPIQHASSKILKKMNRRGDEEFLRTLFQKIRKQVPHAILRTTLIVGFPYETDEDFDCLCRFIEEIEFDHLGVFTYSKEEGTLSDGYSHQISEKVKQKRKNTIMEIQAKISQKRNQTRIGEIQEGLVISWDQDKQSYLVRTYFNAPDEIDGAIYLYSAIPLEIGQSVRIKIVDAETYDLFAVLCEE